jgi:hypothetical protein
MAIDSRDWHRDWWRKRTGYVERALFRISEGERERQKFRAGWRRNFLAVGAAVTVVALIAVAKRSRH